MKKRMFMVMEMEAIPDCPDWVRPIGGTDNEALLKSRVIYADEMEVKKFPEHQQIDIHFSGVSTSPELDDEWIKFGEKLDDALRHWNIGDGVGCLVNAIRQMPKRS